MEYHTYPRWKYSQAGAVVVNSAEEEAALEGEWHDSPADVPSPAGDDSPSSEDEQLLQDAKAEKDALLAKAAELGIAVDKRWGLKRLHEALEQKSQPEAPQP
ncbi:hypothetical protein SAMN06265795_12644 [Noviherbaspirillum humi]|uniref:Uncharacterized protein n=1 Tax=Noviherbaspirillum humi TaxID=1688639 RepID=A0A239LUT9_9BURK|nr:hypothetical protein [Noviherbaspirillum humi]SNT33732.1 hypothetical protein SAMN06265795_12644 [Noviherbaspirillum humi]